MAGAIRDWLPAPPLEKENLVFKRETQTWFITALATSTASIAFLKREKATTTNSLNLG